MPALVLGAALAAALAATGPATAGTLWIPVENMSGTDIVLDLRIAPDIDHGYGPNDLEGQQIHPGESLAVPVAVLETCLHDIRVETDSFVFMAFGIDLCAATGIVVADGTVQIDAPAGPEA
jgi:hypothetical protein